MPDEFKFLNLDAVSAARRLLGSELERELDGHIMRVRIVETEAYDQTDAASHSYNGRTPRNDVMFGPSGHLYVYFTYGMHHCCNVVVGEQGYGAAVLIRAVEPLGGEGHMQARRGRSGPDLTNGPAKLCQALGIDLSHNGHDLSRPPFTLVMKEPVPSKEIVQTTRVGIGKSVDMPWRFYVANNTHVSRP